MKTNFKPLISLLLIFAGAVLIFTTCKKDTECDAVVTVKNINDTLVVYFNANVRIHKEDVLAEGVTDASGQYRHTFKLEAILDIDAMVPLQPIDSLTPADTLYGTSVIRLKPGETVYKTVFVDTIF